MVANEQPTEHTFLVRTDFGKGTACIVAKRPILFQPSPPPIPSGADVMARAQQMIAERQNDDLRIQREQEEIMTNNNACRLFWQNATCTSNASYYLVTARHVLYKKSLRTDKVELFMRPDHGQDFLVVSIDLNDSVIVPDGDVDIAVVPIHFPDGMVPELTTVMHDFREGAVASGGMQAHMAGFPDQGGDYSVWEERGPAVTTLEVSRVVNGKVRVLGQGLNGSSGSLVYTEATDTYFPLATDHIPLGIFVATFVLKGDKRKAVIDGNRATIRVQEDNFHVVLLWSHVRTMLGCESEEVLHIVDPVRLS